jgi:hypothetical protein
MEENNFENLDSLNEGNENLDSLNEGNSDEQNLDALKEKNKDLSDKNRQLFERAKDGEEAKKILRENGYEKKEGKWIKKEALETKKEPESQLNEPNYGQLAFMNSVGVVHPDDQKIVVDEAKRIKLPLTDILQLDYIKSKLENNKTEREVAQAMPRGGNGASGNTQNDVDYWLKKGGLPKDQELAAKVVEARMKGDKSKMKFDESLD